MPGFGIIPNFDTYSGTMSPKLWIIRLYHNPLALIQVLPLCIRERLGTNYLMGNQYVPPQCTPLGALRFPPLLGGHFGFILRRAHRGLVDLWLLNSGWV